MTLMREMSVKRPCQILGESDTRMCWMLFSNVKAAHSRLSFDTVVWVEADEMNRRQGHNYLTVFAELLSRRLLFATSGKDVAVREAFAAKLLRHNGRREAIQRVAIHMSAAYARGVSDNLGNARVVYHKSHLIPDALDACDLVRKDDSRAYSGKRNLMLRTR